MASPPPRPLALAAKSVSKRFDLHTRPPLTFRETVMSWFRRSSSPAGEFWALRDATFEVSQGEAVAIIGANGAGKSTLLKVISRITPPTAGRIELRGRVASLLEVGTGFHPELTGRENVFLNGALLGMRRAEIRRRFDEIVAFSGVEKFVDLPVKHYSSGMYVRLAFSVAAHLEPDILIIDEVLAVGDAEFQKRCLGRMGEVADEGRTVLFVSHNMQAVQSLCRRALLLDHGRVTAEGDARKVVAQYLSRSRVGALEESWSRQTAPGNGGFLVKRIALVPHFSEGDDNVVSVVTPLDVEVEFWSDREPTRFNLSLHLLTLGGDCLFIVGSDVRILDRGLHRGVCRIPGNLLNDGIYQITVNFVRDTTNVEYTLENAITFEVADRRPDGISYHGPWLGHVRPRLPFTLESIAEAPAGEES